MIERNEVQKLADLARITLTEEEQKALRKDLDAIIGYVHKVEEVGVSEIELSLGEVHNITRADNVSHESGAFTEALLKALPQREGEYAKVKRILNQ